MTRADTVIIPTATITAIFILTIAKLEVDLLDETSAVSCEA